MTLAPNKLEKARSKWALLKNCKRKFFLKIPNRLEKTLENFPQMKKKKKEVDICTDRALCVSGEYNSDTPHWNMFNLT